MAMPMKDWLCHRFRKPALALWHRGQHGGVTYSSKFVLPPYLTSAGCIDLETQTAAMVTVV